MAEDHELLARWRDGDLAAGDELVSRYFTSIHRFFRAKLDGDVDELVQRTFVGCLEATERFRSGHALRPFLFGIARRQLLKYLAELRKSARHEDVGELPMATLDPTPTKRVAARQQDRVLLHALRRLPVDMQTTIELFYWESMGIEDIAVALGVAPGTIKSRLHRARTLLREQMADVELTDEVWRTTLDSLNRWAARTRAVVDPEPR